jgi:hypothetical protein
LPAGAAAAGLGAFSEDFNRFDAALCDAALAAVFVDFPAAACRMAAGPVSAFARVFAAFFLGAVLREGVLDDFFRDFWDIRLPFDAFGGSTKAVLLLSSGASDSRPWLGKSDDGGIWLQGFPRTNRLLVERASGAR